MLCLSRRTAAGALILLFVISSFIPCTAEPHYTEELKTRLLARHALREQYGLEPIHLAYFEEVLIPENDGFTVAYYAQQKECDFVFGRYTVRVNGGTAEAAWSWDGRPVRCEGHGLAASAWGKDQLTEWAVLDYYDSDFTALADLIAWANGFAGGYTAPLPQGDTGADYREFDTEGWTDPDRMREELWETAAEALTSLYGIPRNELTSAKDCRFIPMRNAIGEAVVRVTLECVPECADPPDLPSLFRWGGYDLMINEADGKIEEIRFTPNFSGLG